MVKTARAASSLGALRALNQPQPVRTETDAHGMPLAVRIGRDRLAVESIEDVWRVEDEWWRDTRISRTYFEMLLDDGRRITIFRDGVSRTWQRQRYG